MGRPPSGLDECLEWQERFRNQKESGLTVDVFCLQEGISKTTYYRWTNMLKDGIPEALAEEQADREQAEAGEGHFLPVTIKASPVVAVAVLGYIITRLVWPPRSA